MRGSFISVERWKQTSDFEDREFVLCPHLSLEAMKPEDVVYVIQDFYTYDGGSPAGQEVGCVECGKEWDTEADADEAELFGDDFYSFFDYDDEDEDVFAA